MPKKCKVCSGEKYVPCTGRPGYVECMFCGTVYSNDEIEETVSEEKKSIDLINMIKKTKYGSDGIGGIITNGTMYVGYPR